MTNIANVKDATSVLNDFPAFNVNANINGNNNDEQDYRMKKLYDAIEAMEALTREDAPKEKVLGDQEKAIEDAPDQCTRLRQVDLLKKKDYVMVKGRPCEIKEISTKFSAGKHGRAKLHLVGIDIFTGKKYEDIVPYASEMEVPIVETKYYQIWDINILGLAQVKNEGDGRFDPTWEMKLPSCESDLGKEIRKRFSDREDLVLVWQTMCDGKGKKFEGIVGVKARWELSE